MLQVLDALVQELELLARLLGDRHVAVEQVIGALGGALFALEAELVGLLALQVPVVVVELAREVDVRAALRAVAGICCCP